MVCPRKCCSNAVGGLIQPGVLPYMLRFFQHESQMRKCQAIADLHRTVKWPPVLTHQPMSPSLLTACNKTLLDAAQGGFPSPGPADV